ncbi:MAG TPA: hypothetical protein VGJ28_24710 [Micromonosporaceae bacterium]
MNEEKPVLVVDGANVVGSRPDGWWRDRHGAAERLRDALVTMADAYDIVLVVEGQARRVQPIDRVAVVAAPRSGDDEIVRVAAEWVGRERRVLVVTADRELRGRVTAIGAEVTGPKTIGYGR